MMSSFSSVIRKTANQACLPFIRSNVLQKLNNGTSSISKQFLTQKCTNTSAAIDNSNSRKFIASMANKINKPCTTITTTTSTSSIARNFFSSNSNSSALRFAFISNHFRNCQQSFARTKFVTKTIFNNVFSKSKNDSLPGRKRFTTIAAISTLTLTGKNNSAFNVIDSENCSYPINSISKSSDIIRDELSTVLQSKINTTTTNNNTNNDNNGSGNNNAVSIATYTTLLLALAATNEEIHAETNTTANESKENNNNANNENNNTTTTTTTTTGTNYSGRAPTEEELKESARAHRRLLRLPEGYNFLDASDDDSLSFFERAKKKWLRIKYYWLNPSHFLYGHFLLPELQVPTLTIVLDINDLLFKDEDEKKIRYKKRPGVDFLLQTLASRGFEIILWCCNEDSMADAENAGKLDPNRHIASYLFYADTTLTLEGELVKDLSRLNRDLQFVMYISANPDKCPYQKENTIYIAPWEGKKDDTVLLDICYFLMTVADKFSTDFDVRPLLDSYKLRGQDVADVWKPKRLNNSKKRQEDKGKQENNLLYKFFK